MIVLLEFDFAISFDNNKNANFLSPIKFVLQPFSHIFTCVLTSSFIFVQEMNIYAGWS